VCECYQDEVLVNVDVARPGLYRIVYRYVNPAPRDSVTCDVTVTSESSGDVTQSSHVTLDESRDPRLVSASQGGVVTTFVLNPGPLSVALNCPPGVLVVSV